MVDTTNLSGNSPELSYKINFNRPGNYEVWFLSKSVNYEDDSIHVGLDSKYQFTNTTLPKSNNFTWVKVGVLPVDTVGLHNLSIWAREDGITIDRIYLTNNGQPPIEDNWITSRK